jgi:uncharacterized membrane protein
LQPSLAPGQAGDSRIQQAIGLMLRAGVLLSALVVVVGGAVFLLRHGRELPDYRSFRGQPRDFREIVGIVGDAGSGSGSGRGIILLGLLMLVATPVLRVAFTAVAFLRERDRIFAAVALIVLAALGVALFAPP